MRQESQPWPTANETGDAVCIFYNGCTPREEDHTRKSNMFIGEAYVGGLMYGEALDKEHKSPDEFFTLV